MEHQSSRAGGLAEQLPLISPIGNRHIYNKTLKIAEAFYTRLKCIYLFASFNERRTKSFGFVMPPAGP